MISGRRPSGHLHCAPIIATVFYPSERCDAVKREDMAAQVTRLILILGQNNLPLVTTLIKKEAVASFFIKSASLMRH